MVSSICIKSDENKLTKRKVILQVINLAETGIFTIHMHMLRFTIKITKTEVQQNETSKYCEKRRTYLCLESVKVYTAVHILCFARLGNDGSFCADL